VTDQDTQAEQSAPADLNTASRPEAKGGGHLSGPLGLILSVLLLGTAGVFAYRTFYAAEPVALDSPPVMCICAETGKTFEYKLKVNDEFPVESPHTNKKTGYRAEACYWQKDSEEPKAEPTWVLLNEDVDKAGVTECPDCSRVVVRHNPLPPGKGRSARRNPEARTNDRAENSSATSADRG